MPKFRIVVEVGSTQLLAKEFEADTLEEAIRNAESESWDAAENLWEEIDTNTSAEVREDQCKIVTE